MKKIIYIDDTKNRLERIKEQVEKYELQDKVLLFDSIYDIVNIKNGNVQQLKKNINWQNINYIFLHKSLNDSKIPENIVSQIKELLPEGTILFTFSGGSENNLESNILKRELLEKHFSNFLDFAKKFKVWHILVFYYPNSYKLFYASFLLEKLKDENFDSFYKLIQNHAYIDLISLMDWDNNIISSKYNNPKDFLEQAKNIIESEKLKGND